jgi:DNA-binding beta-propeller fold protein YncE
MRRARLSAIDIESSNGSVQHLAPPNNLQRFEGIAFSPCGNKLGVATADTNTIFLFRRKPDGGFEDAPYSSIAGPGSRLNYPHDLSFSSTGNRDLIAVAQRSGSICIYERDARNDSYGSEPVFEITGASTGLNFSDGVAFVPPDNEYVAVCNALIHKLTFYRKAPGPGIAFTSEPAFELQHRSINTPDGLAFTDCGRWLAVANHGNHTVSIHERRGDGEYKARASTIIRDGGLRYPHSVAFTPKTNHLVVTSAGANYFSVYESVRGWFGTRWSRSPVLRQIVGPDDVFQEVNSRNKQEGGPKGVAVHKNHIAVCSPEHGIRIYSFRETAAAA